MYFSDNLGPDEGSANKNSHFPSDLWIYFIHYLKYRYQESFSTYFDTLRNHIISKYNKHTLKKW